MSKQFTGQLEQIDKYRWRIPESYREGMNVPGIVFSDERMIKDILGDSALEQVANAAHLPGVVRASMAMPDIHSGYGLSIGGVVATYIDEGGVVSPGGVGYDINCGVRLLKTNMKEKDIKLHILPLIEEMFRQVPTGVGSTGDIKLDKGNGKRILREGSRWAVNEGYGWDSDIIHCEEQGEMKGADPEEVSNKAIERGRDQAGTLGSGNHFLEVQVVEEIFDHEKAKVMGIEEGLIMVMIHTGSRGLGHQVCSDFAKSMVKSMSKSEINLPDKQLSCEQVDSPQGKRYLGAMRAAANYAWANRQIITHYVRRSFEKVFGERAERLGMYLIYDVAHNIAKIEEHEIDGKIKKLCVHRKGATRALPPGHEDVPDKYKKTGQPVIIPGDMGTCSYLLAGALGAEETFYSTCHGAGRRMSRSLAKKVTGGRDIVHELEEKGIVIRYTGRDTLHEEVPDAYKNVTKVVDVVEGAGISKKVAKMRPLGVIKG